MARMLVMPTQAPPLMVDADGAPIQLGSSLASSAHARHSARESDDGRSDMAV